MKALLTGIVLLFATALASAQTIPQTGFPTFGSFETGSVDSVNRQNLNTQMQFPIVSDGGRGLGFNFAISYNSLLWEKNGLNWSFSTPVDFNSSPGWNLLGETGFVTETVTTTICHPSGVSIHAYAFVYIDQNGTQHSVPAINYNVSCTGTITGTTSGYAADSSGYYMSAEPSTVVRGPDGTQLRGAWKDSNGNFITLGSTVTDSAGHAVLKTTQTSSSITYQYLDPTGAYQTITLALASYNVKTNFGCSGITEFSGATTLPSSLTYPNGWVYAFTYEPTPGNSGYITGRLSKITLPNGGYVQYAFGGSNDGIDCATGNVLNLTRTINDGTTSWVWQFVSSGGTGGTTTVTAPKMPYDSAANQTLFTFNSSGQETSEQIYQGSSTGGTLLRTINTTWSGNSPATKTTILGDNSTQSEVETSYDNYGNLLSLKEHDFGTGAPGPILRTTTFTYLNTSAYITANILNRVTEESIADSTGTVRYVEDTAYDGSALSPCPTGVVQHDDGNYGCSFLTRGNPTSVTTYTNASTKTGAVAKNKHYDMFGNVVLADADCCQSMSWNFSATTEYSSPDSVVSGLSSGTHTTTNYTYNFYTGQIASITDPNSQVTSYAYDAMRRQTTLTRPDSAQIIQSYNDTLHTVSTSNPIQGTAVITHTNYLDGLGRTSQTSIFDASNNLYSTTQTEYDGLDRPYYVSNPFTSSAQYWTETTYDALGRQAKMVLQDSSQTTFAYSTSSITQTDPAGHQRKMQTDGLNRLSVVYEPDPANGNSLTLQSSYGYTVLDNLASLTQGSQTRTYSYDGMGRLTSHILPESGTTSFQYNTYNQISQRTDARGVITTYTYDTMNRPYQISYNVGTTGVPATPTVTYTFGSNASQYNNGRLLTLTDGLGTTTNTYDNLARATQVQHVINGSIYTIGYGYNLAGAVTSLTYPSGRVVQPSYDAIGRLSSLASGTTTYTSSFSYNSAFAPTNFTMGNGVAVTAGYSANRLQLQSLNYTGGSTVFSTAYAYTQNGGNNGQITSVTDSVDAGRSVTYTYDALNRVSTAVTTGSTAYPKWGLSFAYDRYGNRTAQTVTAGTAPSNSVVVSATTNHITTSGYAYDLNGNMTNDAVNTITYDGENRLVSSSGSAGSGTYSYRASGLRAVKVSGGTTTVYLFDGNRDIAEYANGTLANEYVYLGSKMIASHLSGTLYYHASDHQSIRVHMDTSGNIMGQKGHYSFGEDWYSSALTNRHFTSYERDSESSNDNALNRFYVNRLGRFSANDPMPGGGETPQGFDLYNYVRSDPVNNADPDGRFNIPCELIIGCGCDPEFGFCDGGGGGGGGGSCNPDSVEGNSCPPPEPTPPPPPSPPACFCQLKYRPVNDPRVGPLGATHAFWYIQDPVGSQRIVSGENIHGYLNVLVSGNLYGDDSVTATTWFNSGLSSRYCLSAEAIEANAYSWPNRIVYNPIGPNSNTAAHVLGTDSTLVGFFFRPPPGSTGWWSPL